MNKRDYDKIYHGTYREKRPNGDIYVYERLLGHDPVTHKTFTLSLKLQGKIPAGESEITKTRSKAPAGMRKQPSSTKRIHTGLTDILEWAGRESGIDRDLAECFHTGIADKIRSIARYWIATDGRTLTRMASWQAMHPLPYPGFITDNVYSPLFKTLGEDEQGIQAYFQHRAARLKSNPVLALDTTTMSTYSEQLQEARYGFNKDGDGLRTIKLLVIYSVEDCEPVAFYKQPGNIPDVISLTNALKQLKTLDIEKVLLVTDNGFCSENNIMEMCCQNLKFITLLKEESTWVQEEIERLKPELKHMRAFQPSDFSISGATSTVNHIFSRSRRRTRNGIAAGTQEKLTKRLYISVFHSQLREHDRAEKFRMKLQELKEKVERGVTEFSTANQRLIDKYLTRSTVGRGGALRVGFNDTAIEDSIDRYGYFALCSNKVMPTFTVLKYYRLREKIEEMFANEKERCDARRPHVWSADRLRGRQFVQFIAISYYCFLAKKINEIKENLCTNPEQKSSNQLKQEEQLKNWLKDMSFAKLMDWFDAIETTIVKSETANVRWSTELTARERLFLKMLGVLKV